VSTIVWDAYMPGRFKETEHVLYHPPLLGTHASHSANFFNLCGAFWDMTYVSKQGLSTRRSVSGPCRPGHISWAFEEAESVITSHEMYQTMIWHIGRRERQITGKRPLYSPVSPDAKDNLREEHSR
jgi:hypothetical protein